jgi:fucose permease
MFTATRSAFAGAGAPGEGPAKHVPALGALAALKVAGVKPQLAIFFLYAGLEVSAGQWSSTVLIEARGVDPVLAGAIVSLYWGCLWAGRLLVGLFVERVGTARMVRWGATLAVLGAAGFGLQGLPVWLSGASLGLVGLGLSPIYPGLMALTPHRLGPAAQHAIGFQVSAATAGVALVPTLAGLAGQRWGLGAVPISIAALALLLAALNGLQRRE